MYVKFDLEYNLLIILGYGPFSTLKNGFRFITFKNISVLDSYFIYKHTIIKYRSDSC